jgi:hypothetical protein
MSTLNTDFPNINPGPIGEDGLNDYQRAQLTFWLSWNAKSTDRVLIHNAIKSDPRLLLWADWPTMLRYGKWLERTGS